MLILLHIHIQRPPHAGPPSSCQVPPDTHEIWLSPKAQIYAAASSRRALAMDRLLWHSEEGVWRDYWTRNGRTSPQIPPQQPQHVVSSASNYMPLWGRVVENPALLSVRSSRKTSALASLKTSGLIQIGGVTTTNKETGEQWDKANAWSPIVHMMIDGLEGLDDVEASSMAKKIAKGWLESNYLGWINTGYMYEKYHAFIPGARGEGGEYYPQVGFGWTNGVVLHLLKTYGKSLTTMTSPTSSSSSSAASARMMVTSPRASSSSSSSPRGGGGVMISGLSSPRKASAVAVGGGAGLNGSSGSPIALSSSTASAAAAKARLSPIITTTP